MSKLSQAIFLWKKGILAITLVFLIGIMAPVVSLALLSAIIILPMELLGFDLDFWDESGLGFVILAIVVLGPYYLGETWDEITKLVLK